MARDPLQTVRLLRQRAVDEGRMNLAKAIADEAAAGTRARMAEQVIEAEASRATDTLGGDELVEAFAAWLPGARARVASARADEERLGAEVTIRRAELVALRTGLEVVETLLRQKKEAAEAVKARQGQQMIDEAAGRPSRVQ